MSEIFTYKPSNFDYDIEPLQVPSAWVGLEKVIRPLLNDFGVKNERALEFGVDWGYSLSALAHVFDKVVGVDHFKGDPHTGHASNPEKVAAWMKSWPNTTILIESFDQYFSNSARSEENWNLCHIDISPIHKDYFECGRKAAGICECLIMHDTEAFPDVKRACSDLADHLNWDFYNYAPHYGLGILVPKEKSDFYRSRNL